MLREIVFVNTHDAQHLLTKRIQFFVGKLNFLATA